MKKSFFLIAASAAVLLCSCSKEQEEKTLSVEEPFSIYAGFATTKTTTSDGTKVSWLKDDAINVFHVETGTTNYVNDGKFTIADVSTGRFTGTLASELEDGKSYDWYLLYPYKGNKFDSPDKARMWVGGGSSFTETARAGNLYPLYGKVKNMKAGSQVNAAMSQLATVFKIKITNDSEVSLALSSVTFAVSSYRDLNGQYDIDFTGDAPTYKLNWGDGKVNMNISDVTVAPGNSTYVYISTIPFTVAAGSTMSMSVNGCTKTNTVKTAKKYEAGKVYNFSYSYRNGVTLTGTALSKEVGMTQTLENSSVYAWVGTLSAGKLGIRITDTDGTSYVNAGTSLSEGEVVSVTTQTASSEITIPSEDTYRVVLDTENKTLAIYNSANEFNKPFTATWHPNNNSSLAAITTEVTNIYLRGSAAGWASAGKNLNVVQSLADPQVLIYSGSSFSGTADFAIISSYSYDGNGDGTNESYNVNNSYVFAPLRVDNDSDGVHDKGSDHTDAVVMNTWTDMSGGSDIRGNYFNCSGVNFITFDLRNMKIKFENR